MGSGNAPHYKERDMTNDIKLKELQVILQRALDTVDWKKVKCHNDYHLFVRQVIRPLLPRELSIWTWSVRWDSDHDGDVFKYSRDFVKYKNCTWADKGTFTNVTIDIVDELNPETKVSELFKWFEGKKALQKFERLISNIESLETELSYAKEMAEELHTYFKKGE